MKNFKVTIKFKDEPTQIPRSYFYKADSKKEVVEIVRKTTDGEISISCIEGKIVDNMFYPI